MSQLTQAAQTIKKLSAEAVTVEDIDSTINEFAEKSTFPTMLRSSSATGLGIAPQYQTSWAVIIGIDEYQSNELTPLKYAVNNATNIECSLRATGFQTIVLLNKVLFCFVAVFFILRMLQKSRLRRFWEIH